MMNNGEPGGKEEQFKELLNWPTYPVWQRQNLGAAPSIVEVSEVVNKLLIRRQVSGSDLIWDAEGFWHWAFWWGVLLQYGVQRSLLEVLQSLYTWKESCVIVLGRKLNTFSVGVGICQGCSSITFLHPDSAYSSSSIQFVFFKFSYYFLLLLLIGAGGGDSWFLHVTIWISSK